jgi:hypothetical protein
MIKTASENLQQIKEFLSKIDEPSYTKKSNVLFGASVGEHVRHIVEFYIRLVVGSKEGVICYDKRTRDLNLATNTSYTINKIDELLVAISDLDLSSTIEFEADYTVDGSKDSIIHSSIARELAYCIEHSIHHQALVKAGLHEMQQQSLVACNFGIAYSTIRYKDGICAQ